MMDDKGIGHMARILLQGPTPEEEARYAEAAKRQTDAHKRLLDTWTGLASDDDEQPAGDV